MNVGQILETHLGWAARGLGEKIQAQLEKSASVKLCQRVSEKGLRLA